ncbi:hypothetical protein [Corynebacterium sp.]|uniref:TRAFAC clade GTPase domain-containing protein n=1 Tax=Corynebacterium sp. TaxID=1720 RepID=UPI0037364323
MTQTAVSYDKTKERLATRCPYTFQVMPDPGATSSPFLSSSDQEKYPLPEGWQGSGTLTFAMAGARSSGKSLYIAVIVKLLKKLVVANHGTFRYADEYTRRNYEQKYEAPLFEKMGLLPPTPPASSADAHQMRPLIFDVGMHERDGGLQKIFVVFRDVAGEDLKEENFEERQGEMDFFREAERILFLFDPMAVPRIRQLLEGSVPMHEVGADDPTAVLQNVLRVLGTEHRPGIALCLSKFDTMQQLADVNQTHHYSAGQNAVNWQRVMSNYGASFRREGVALDEPFDTENSFLLHLEVESLLQCLDATQMLNQLNTPLFGQKNYPYHCYAVSALGAPPEGDRVSRIGIAPFRCMDPLRQVFSEFGLFDGSSRTSF